METDSKKNGRRKPADSAVVLSKFISRELQCCRNCEFSQLLRANQRTGTCHYNPPVVMQVMMPNVAAMLQPGQPAMQAGLQGAWPPVD